MSDWLTQYLEVERAKANRRKCFISYYSADREEVDQFIASFSDVMITKAIGVSDGDDFIDSTDADYVMNKIREKYLGDSTVTILLLGSCTHSRRYIDWELKSSLRRGSYTPNGLLGILLPSMGSSAVLPPRFKENWDKDDSKYALYRSYPNNSSTLKSWIEEAYSRRTSRANLILNSQEMFKYSRKCEVHGVTH
jgi:hypothetical protein